MVSSIEYIVQDKIWIEDVGKNSGSRECGNLNSQLVTCN
jgi:hypothetical protein